VTPFERKSEPLLPLPKFIRRLATWLGISAAVIFGALFAGVLGYRAFAHLSWIDSLLNASMILTGMGPVATLDTTPAKLFASAYALFSGIVFLSAVGIMLAPVFHRFIHKFHLEKVSGK
jgi:hypothetical protein